MDSNGTTSITNKRFYFEFLLPVIFRPRATFPQVIQKRATWLTPLLVISLLIVARVMLAAPATPSIPVDINPVEPGVPVPGPYGKGGMKENGLQVISAELQKGGGGGGGEGEGGGLPPAASTGFSMENLIPAIGTTVSLWAGWFLLSVLLYIGMVVSGSNSSFTQTLNLTAWASLPLALRQVVMLIAALAAPSVGANPAGLSALGSLLSGPAGMFLTALLKSVDIYLVWQAILIVIGLHQVSPLTLRRIFGITLGAVALFLVLAALPGFFSAIFAQLTAPVPVTY